ncbi:MULTISPECIES: helix-turn-helix domain-containing protein [unclassified Variovorax]|uniref:helix-turn-helix domain-containing protein n=1 Tax=unclassified Variovorax TaxID=663243 RepID=UPI003ECF7E9E
MLQAVARANPQRPAAAAKSEYVLRLGEQIKALRVASDQTAGDMSRATGISRSMLSRVERGLVSPSVETLRRIAAGLDVPLSRFFSDQPARNDLSFVRAGEGVIVDRSGAVADYRYQLLGHVLSGNLFVEPYLVELLENAKPYVSFQHPGMKFLHMKTGRVRYRFGERVAEVREGDSLLFEASVLHGIEEVLQHPVSYLVVVFTIRE